MKRILVSTECGICPVFIGKDLASLISEEIKKIKQSNICIVTDSMVRKLWGRKILSELAEFNPIFFSFPNGEKNKTQKTATKLQNEMLKRGMGRDTLLVALGGGVVGDLAGFVASTYMRGIPYIQIPTTVLAMVDSSIGGKTGIDTSYGKNMIGSFHQPKAVFVDVRFLETLPEKHIKNGLFEAVKTFLTSDFASLELAREIDCKNPLADESKILSVIGKSLAIKAGVVSIDEKEKGERKILNFGHTVGHAIELLSDYKILHGFAIAEGMIVEARISEKMGVLSHGDCALVENYLADLGVKESFSKKMRAKNYREKALRAMRIDKKSCGNKIKMVLLSGIGKVKVENGDYAHEVDEKLFY